MALFLLLHILMLFVPPTSVRTYLEHMTASTGDREQYVDNLVSEMAGFAGCEIVRR